MNDLIRDRDERTRRRKKYKRKMDELIGLSYHEKDKNALSLSMNIAKMSDTTIRLLDEGFVDNDGGFVIKKGTMEKFIDGNNQYVRGWELVDGEWAQTEVLNLTDSFVGSVNLGHMDFSTFPFVIGEWTKNDLSLVDTENDRQGIDVALRLDEDSVFVRELKRQPYDIGVSAEFWYHINADDTESLTEMLGEYTPVIDEIFIFAYGLVGECGNVNSSGLELKGDFDMKKEEITKEIEQEVKPIEESVTDETEKTEEPMTEAEEEKKDEEVKELSEEEEAPSAEDEDEADEEDTEGDEAESDEEDEDEETDGEEAYSDVEAYISGLEEENKNLKEENAELKKSLRRSQKKLKNEYEKKEAFVSKFSTVASALGEEEAPKKEKSSDYITGDGIGE